MLRNLLIALLFWWSVLNNYAYSDEQVDAKLQIWLIDDAIFVAIENAGSKPFDIASNFELGGSLPNSPLYIEVRDESGNILRVTGVIDSGFIPDSIRLEAYHSYGRRFEIDSLRKYFQIKAGVYGLRAIYDEKIVRRLPNDSTALDRSLRLESKWVTVDLD